METLQELKENFVSGRCQTVTADRAELVALRAHVPNGAEEYVILPETISEEPLGPVVGRDDAEWLLVVKWVLNALIEAEARGITQANACEPSRILSRPRNSSFPCLQWFAGKDLKAQTGVGP